MGQYMHFNAEITQDDNFIADIQNKIIEKLKQKAEAEGVMFSMSGTSSEILSKLNTDVKNSVNTQSLQELSNSLKANQELEIDGSDNITYNIKMNQELDFFLEASKKMSSNIELATKIDKKVDSEAKAETKNFLEGIFDGLFGPIGQAIAVVVVIIAVVVAAIGYNMFGGGGNDPRLFAYPRRFTCHG